MKGEGNPPDPYLVLFLEPFNTPGDEVAPGSDVIGENLQYESIIFIHGVTSSIDIRGYAAASATAVKERFLGTLSGLNPKTILFSKAVFLWKAK
jgi:hypothetical protein